MKYNNNYPPSFNINQRSVLTHHFHNYKISLAKLWFVFVFLTSLLSFAEAGQKTTEWPLNPQFKLLADNTAVDLGKYVCQSNAGDSSYPCGGIIAYSGFVYDETRHVLMMFGGGHAAVFRDDVDIFDLKTLRWKRSYEPTPCNQMNAKNYLADPGYWKSTNLPFSRHTYDMLAITHGQKPGNLFLLGSTNGIGGCVDRTLTRADGSDPFYITPKIAYFNLEKNKWTYTNEPTFDPLATSEFDPISGKFIILNGAGLWTLDPNTYRKQMHIEYNKDIGMGYANHLVYFPPLDKFYYFARGEEVQVFELSINRNNIRLSEIKKLTDLKNSPRSLETGYDYDATNEVIAGNVVNGVIQIFNPRNRTWKNRKMLTQPLGLTIGSMPEAWHGIQYIKSDNVFIFFAVGNDGLHTWAYKLANNKM